MTIQKFNKCGQCAAAYNYDLDNCPKCQAPQWAATTLDCSPLDYGYDIETYPNIFTLSAKHILTGKRWFFEISQWRDDSEQLYDFLRGLMVSKSRMVGFNNMGFDYPVVHEFLSRPTVSTSATLYRKASSIIDGDRFEHVIWNPPITQIDLFKINHFDNRARSVSLKVLEFNMLSHSVEDLPFKPGTVLNYEQRQELIYYNDHDVDETIKFYHHCTDKIKFREELSEKYNKYYLNHNDTKIGKDYFITILEQNQPGICYDNNRNPRQTIRSKIDLNQAVFDYIKFNSPEFNRIKEWLQSQTITETKGVFKGLSCSVKGFDYHFGVGGIHGSIESQIVRSDDNHIIVDLDVASYYPNLAIANNLYPEHLSAKFCEIYNDVYQQRKGYPKGTPENIMLKYALNGVYGDSNSVFSPFYDPLYTMSITINGQLLLCLLAEWLGTIDKLQMIQINTDGLTVKIPRNLRPVLDNIAKKWETFTGLTLDAVNYKAMYIRDVNSYIGEYEDGELKRKGAYGHNRDDEGELPWHKDHSSLIIPKAAEAALVRGECPIEFIVNHKNKFDFMLRAKCPRSNWIEFEGIEQQNVVRYFVSNNGGDLYKMAPPIKGAKVGDYKRRNGVTDHYYHEVLNEIGPGVWDERIHTKNKSTYQMRKTFFQKGQKVTVCNNVEAFNWSILNYEYYIKEALKLIEPLKS